MNSLATIGCENTSQEKLISIISADDFVDPLAGSPETCPLTLCVDAPLDVVYEYLSDVRTLAEWTYSIRNIVEVSDGLYRAEEHIQPDTQIYVSCEHARSETFATVLYPCAWDQGNELWMRYYFLLVDASLATKQPGTLIHWVNFKHPYYEKRGEAPAEIQAAWGREDRMWVGEIWPWFYEGHAIEANNLRLILNARAEERARRVDE